MVNNNTDFSAILYNKEPTVPNIREIYFIYSMWSQFLEEKN